MAGRIDQFLHSITPQQNTRITGKTSQDVSKVNGEAQVPEFGKLLKEKMETLSSTGLKFSAHAEQRLISRHIEFSDNQLKQLDEAVGRAAQKGAQESLVLLDDIGLVVSVKNRTVVTAVDKDSMNGNVFTNIDSVVVVKDEE